MIALIGIALLILLNLPHQLAFLIENKVRENPQRLLWLGQISGDHVFFPEFFIKKVHLLLSLILLQ